MARYTGPKSRIARKFGEPILDPISISTGKISLPASMG